MTDGSSRRIAQEIRHQRALLTAEETWWQQQPASEARTDGFRRINFWRNVLKDGERRLALGDIGEATTDRPRPSAAVLT